MAMTQHELATHQILVLLLAYAANETAMPLHGRERQDQLRGAIGASMASMLWVARHRSGSRWMLPPTLQRLVDDVLELHQPSDESVQAHPAGGLQPKVKVTMAHVEAVRSALERHEVEFELAGLHEFVKDFVARAEEQSVPTTGDEWLAVVDACARVWKGRQQ